jgi:hypothetical protein
MSANRPTDLFLTQGDNRALRTWRLWSRDAATGAVTAVDLTSAVAVAVYVPGMPGSPLACTWLADTTGTVSRLFLTADMAVAGDFPFETQVTWGDGTVRTIPSPGKDIIHVAAQLA